MWYTVQAKPAPKRNHRFPRHIHDSRKLKIGLIGGSFNPVHRGHLFIAKAALKFLNLDEVWWLVSLKNPFKSNNLSLKLNTRISLYTSIVLIIFGMIMFYFLEQNNSLNNMTIYSQLITSFFQSVTRTAGFNTVDISLVGTPMLIIFIFLMKVNIL